MATLTNISKNTASLTNITKPLTGGQVFYGWLFLFTISSYATVLTNISKHSVSLTNIAKS
jgi:hypothetical protein